MTRINREFSAGKALALHEMFRYEFENGLLAPDVNSFRTYVQDLASMPELTVPADNSLAELLADMVVADEQADQPEGLEPPPRRKPNKMPKPGKADKKRPFGLEPPPPKVTQVEAVVETNSVRGRKHYKAKLTENDVMKIKKRLAKGEKASSIAKDFDCTADNINSIKRGDTWKHVTV